METRDPRFWSQQTLVIAGRRVLWFWFVLSFDRFAVCGSGRVSPFQKSAFQSRFPEIRFPIPPNSTKVLSVFPAGTATISISKACFWKVFADIGLEVEEKKIKSCGRG